MRWTALVVAVLACGCGDGGGGDAAQADTAPACDIPPMVCEGGGEAFEAGRAIQGGAVHVCDQADGSVLKWTVFTTGPVVFQAGGESTYCWSATTTVAGHDTYDGAEVTRECWARDGEPADCDEVVPELNALAQPPG